MKKLLSILGSVAIAASSASAVVACTDSGYKQDMLGPKKGIQSSHENDQAEIQASLLARAKSLILNNEFGLSDTVTNKYVMNQKLSEYNVTKPDISGLKINDVYSTFINDSSITNANPKLNMNGIIGDDGGIVEKAEQSIINLLTNSIGSNVPDMAKQLLNGILSAQGFNNLIGEGKLGQAISDALQPILQVLGQLNTPTAMTGIPYALTLIPPTLQKYSTLTKLASSIIDLLQSYRTQFDGLLKPFVEASDLTSYGDKSLSDIQDAIASVFGEMINGKGGTKLGSADLINDCIKLIPLIGYYLSFFSDDEPQHEINDADTFKEMSNTATFSASPYYSIYDEKTDADNAKKYNGKGFNIAALLKGIAYFVGDEATPNSDKIRKFMQITLLKDGTSADAPELSSIGKFVCEMLGKLLPKVGESNLEAFVTKALSSKDADNLWDAVFNDWSKLTDKELPGISDSLKDVDLQRAFHNDNTGADTKTYSLSNLLQIPLYKILMLAKTDGFYSDGKDGEVGNTDLDKTGLLPSFAGFFTQKSITGLAVESKSVFKMDDVLTNKDLSSYYFLFGDSSLIDSDSVVSQTSPSTLNKFLDELLFFDPYNSDSTSKKGVLSEIVQWIAEPDAWKYIANKLGYVLSNDGSLNKNLVKKQSIMGDIIMMLIPKIALDNEKKDTISLDDVIGHANNDNLTFFASGLSSFVGDILKPTNYNYWFQYMFNKRYGKYLFNIDNSSDGPWVDPLGFTNHKFAKSDFIKDMTLKVTFDFSKLDEAFGLTPDDIKAGKHASLINLIPLNYEGHAPTTWTFTISRDDFTQAFSFIDIEKN